MHSARHRRLCHLSVRDFCVDSAEYIHTKGTGALRLWNKLAQTFFPQDCLGLPSNLNHPAAADPRLRWLFFYFLFVFWVVLPCNHRLSSEMWLACVPLKTSGSKRLQKSVRPPRGPGTCMGRRWLSKLDGNLSGLSPHTFPGQLCSPKQLIKQHGMTQQGVDSTLGAWTPLTFPIHRRLETE
jgi:hypothetical protein